MIRPKGHESSDRAGALEAGYEAEKNRVVASYENQIQSMKTGHREQMESLKEYKRLS